MADTVATKQTKGSYKYMCGTPRENCGGGLSTLSGAFAAKGLRTHSNPREAMLCHGRYLESIGFERLNAREYRAPDGSGIRVLTKQSRFGARMRPGKAGRNMPSGRRMGGYCVST